MKRLALIIVCAFMAGCLLAQTKELEALSKLKDVEYIHVDKATFKKLAETKGAIKTSKGDLLGDPEGKIFKMFDEAIIIITESDDAAEKVFKNAENYIKADKLVSLLEAKRDFDGYNDHIKVYHALDADKHTYAFIGRDEKWKACFCVFKGPIELPPLNMETLMDLTKGYKYAR